MSLQIILLNSVVEFPILTALVVVVVPWQSTVPSKARVNIK